MKPLKLPTEPVNGYEIRLWRISDYEWTVREWRFVYHADTLWKDVFPGEDAPWGANFTDEWAVYQQHFVHRLEGWEWRQDGWAPFFKTEREAEEAMCEHLRDLIERKRLEMQRFAIALSKVDAGARTPVEKAVRQLYDGIVNQYGGYDIYAGWNVKKDSDEGRAAATALDIVISEMRDKATGL